MSDQPTNAAGKTGANPTVGLLLALVLIAHFLWNFLVPAHEYPLRTEQVMTMAFDLGMVVGLFAFRVIPAPLFWIALAAGIGLFAFRLTEDGWWTGHFAYSLPSRR